MKIPSLLFLPVEHYTSKCYLAAMQQLDAFPERTIFLDTSGGRSQPQRKSRLVRRAAGAARRSIHLGIAKLSNRSQYQANFNKHAIREKVGRTAESLGLPCATYQATTREMMEQLGIDYEVLAVDSINDPRLIEFLSEQVTQQYALFTGGGILREKVLATGLRFIHIHPGCVPDVRGSCCILWSALVRGKIGASCFFMNAGIDTGDIIDKKEYDIPNITLPPRLLGDETLQLREAIILDYLDPCYRADLLRTVLRRNLDPAAWAIMPQASNEGRFYYYPHRRISEKAVSLFFRQSGAQHA